MRLTTRKNARQAGYALDDMVCLTIRAKSPQARQAREAAVQSHGFDAASFPPCLQAVTGFPASGI